jgi:hypothetical protein
MYEGAFVKPAPARSGRARHEPHPYQLIGQKGKFTTLRPLQGTLEKLRFRRSLGAAFSASLEKMYRGLAIPVMVH